MQWKGLSPDETSWEDWSQLCSDFHLEDKVSLQGPKDDTEPDSTTETTATKTKREVQIEDKPKRKLTKPAYLNDYV